MPIVEHRFLASKKLYALDLESFEAEEFPDLTSDGYKMWKYTISAVWFRKRSNGRIAAFFGTLSELSTGRPEYGSEDRTPRGVWDLNQFLEGYKSARYGGNPGGCWDGQGTWWSGAYNADYEAQQEVLPGLKKMLENYPEIPKPYVGWYALTEPYHG